MKEIIVIIPYFGTLPKMFKFWYQSAVNNPTIDYLFFTDCSIEETSNIKVVKVTFEELKAQIQSKFDFKIELPSPYKFCDYRPAYGDIFKDYLEGYDFWGFGDIDLVYGNIRHFLTEDVLNNYDIISGWGHLTLYRNNDFCNRFYRKKVEGYKYFKDVYTNPKNQVFDEYLHAGMSDRWEKMYPDRIWNSKLFDDIKVPRLAMNFISVFHPEYSENLIFEYSESKLYRIYRDCNGEICREQTLYAHFQQRKFLKISTCNLEHYLIVPNRIIDYQNVTIDKLKMWTRSQELKRRLYNLKNRIKHRLNIIFK